MTTATAARETPQQAARRLLAGPLRKGFEPADLHEYRAADGAPLFWRARLKHPETGEKAIRPIRWNGERFELGEPPAPPQGRPLYGLDRLAARSGEPVIVVEGEACADALGGLGLLAVTSGGADSAGRADWQPLASRDVTIWPDNDEAGLRYGADVSERLRPLGCRVRLVDVAALNLPPKGDAVDWLAMDPAATAADVLRLPVVEPADRAGDDSPMVSRRLADVKAEPVRWLWPGRIARGKVTVLAGDPGLGKSQLTASLAAIVTTGGKWPDSETPAEVGAVAFLNAEDDAADTLKPRLIAAGADLRLCHVLDAVRATDRDGLPIQRGFDLSRDVSVLAEKLARIGSVRLLVIDPISAYLGAVDSHRNAEVRALLAPLSAMAAGLGVAVLAVSHLNKSGSADALSRVTGSLAFVAAARAAWIVAKDPQDPARRLFVAAKNNLGPDGAGLSFCIRPVTIDGDIGTSRIAWHAEPVTMTANEALAAVGARGGLGTELRTPEAEDWLLDALAAGPVATEDLRRRARADGLAWRTVERARSALKLKARRCRFGAGGLWAWELPHGTEDRQGADAIDRQSDGKPIDRQVLAVYGGLCANDALTPFSDPATPKTANAGGVGDQGPAGHSAPTPGSLAVYGDSAAENAATMRVSPKTAIDRQGASEVGGLWEGDL